MCRRVIEETGLLPHPNAGVLSRRELAELREVAPSQGIMLETTAARLCGPGGPHEHAPDKKPATRLAMIRKAGELRIPFTSGILIGIGETTSERIDAIFALRDLHDRYGHIQEIIVQNFRSKPDTPMAEAGEPGLIDLMSACAITRIVMGPEMNIQAPPNLSADYGPLLVAGINDWGGISPSPGLHQPEAPRARPDLTAVRRRGYELRERLTIYPDTCTATNGWHRDPRARADDDRCHGLSRGRSRRMSRTVTIRRGTAAPPLHGGRGLHRRRPRHRPLGRSPTCRDRRRSDVGRRDRGRRRRRTGPHRGRP